MKDFLVRKGIYIESQQTRRSGIRERRLLTIEDSPHQNVLIFEVEEGAEVEFHQIHTSESLYILEGIFEIFSRVSKNSLSPGDLVHFPSSSSHGMRCVQGPGRYLGIFAPAVQKTTPKPTQ